VIPSRKQPRCEQLEGGTRLSNQSHPIALRNVHSHGTITTSASRDAIPSQPSQPSQLLGRQSVWMLGAALAKASSTMCAASGSILKLNSDAHPLPSEGEREGGGGRGTDRQTDR
jgi:hypothetical protein